MWDEETASAFAQALMQRVGQMHRGVEVSGATAASASSDSGSGTGDPRDRLYVVVDGDDLPIPTTSLIGPISAGDRVMVMFVPPQGAFVVAWALRPARTLPQPFPFAAGWSNFATYEDVRYWKDTTGVVHIYGVGYRAAGAVAKPVTVGTLPAGFRPAQFHRFGDFASTAAGSQANIEPDGDVVLGGGGTADFFSIDTFFIAAG